MPKARLPKGVTANSLKINSSYAYSDLTITDVQNYNIGKYYCVAELKLSSDRSSVNEYYKLIDIERGMSGMIVEYMCIVGSKETSSKVPLLEVSRFFSSGQKCSSLTILIATFPLYTQLTFHTDFWIQEFLLFLHLFFMYFPHEAHVN